MGNVSAIFYSKGLVKVSAIFANMVRLGSGRRQRETLRSELKRAYTFLSPLYSTSYVCS